MLENKDHSEDSIDAFYKRKANDYRVNPEPNAFGTIIGKTSLDTHDPIDSFYKQKSERYSVQASPNAFEQIMSKTTLPQNPISSLLKPFKIGGMIVGIGAITIAAWFSFENQQGKTSIDTVQPNYIDEVLPKKNTSFSEEPINIIEKEIIQSTQNTQPIENQYHVEPTTTPSTLPQINNPKTDFKDETINETNLKDISIVPTRETTPNNFIMDEVNVNSSKESAVEKEFSIEENLMKFKQRHNVSDSTGKLFNEKEKK